MDPRLSLEQFFELDPAGLSLRLILKEQRREGMVKPVLRTVAIRRSEMEWYLRHLPVQSMSDMQGLS